MISASLLAALLSLPLLLQPASAEAGCSRVIRAPMAPSARLVIVENGQVDGVWPDLLREVGETVGCRFDFSPMPRARLEMEFLSGQRLDLMISATRTAERDRHGLFVALIHQPMVLLTRSADADRIASLEALRKSGWRMAMPRSFAFSADFRALVGELEAERRVDTVNDIDAVARMLRAGRVDFALLSPPQAQAAVVSGLAFRRFDGLPMMEVGLYLSRQTLAPADLALLRDALARGAREGLVRRAFLRHYPPEVADLNQP